MLLEIFGITWCNDGVSLTIRNLISFVMPIIDLKKLSNNNTSHRYKEEAKYWGKEEAKRPFDECDSQT